jgi:MoaA/NifB/PqqE/SkfB family radical SAM enzyme
LKKQLQTCKEFIRIRDEHFAKTGYYCRVTFQLTFMQNNMHELADIVKLAAQIGVDRVKGHQLWAHFDEIKHLSMKATPESILQWNEYVNQANEAQEKFRKPNGEKVILENIIPLNRKRKQRNSRKLRMSIFGKRTLGICNRKNFALLCSRRTAKYAW